MRNFMYRQLVIEYARHRASLGAKFNRVDWGKLHNLPAPPDACRRRMALLRTNRQFRKSITRLCNVLSQRYVDYLEKSKDKQLNHEGHQATQCCCLKNTSNFLAQDPWDNFDDADIKLALEDALRYKKISKSETFKDVHPFFDNNSDVNTDEKDVRLMLSCQLFHELLWHELVINYLDLGLSISTKISAT